MIKDPVPSGARRFVEWYMTLPKPAAGSPDAD